MELFLRFADLAFDEINNLFRLSDAAVLASRVPTITLSRSKRMTEAGDPLRIGIRDDLGFAVRINGATAEKSSRRSIPIALRLLMWSFPCLALWDSRPKKCSFHAFHALILRIASSLRKRRFRKAFDHHSRGPQHLAVPGKSAFHLPNDRSIFTGILGWLNVHHPLPGTIGLRLRFHFTDIESLKNRHQEMEQIIEVIP